MTQNAVSYFGMQETRRANRQQEQELQRHNRATEEVSRAQVEEMERHNRAAEWLESERTAELRRHNYEQEQAAWGNIQLGYANVQQAYSSLAESIRSHKVQEAELIRSNLAKEAETLRHNRVTEFTGGVSAVGNVGIGLINARSSARQASAAQTRARTEAQQWQAERTDPKFNPVAQWFTWGWNSIKSGVDSGARLIDAIIPF